MLYLFPNLYFKMTLSKFNFRLHVTVHNANYIIQSLINSAVNYDIDIQF